MREFVYKMSLKKKLCTNCRHVMKQMFKLPQWATAHLPETLVSKSFVFSLVGTESLIGQPVKTYTFRIQFTMMLFYRFVKNVLRIIKSSLLIILIWGNALHPVAYRIYKSTELNWITKTFIWTVNCLYRAKIESCLWANFILCGTCAKTVNEALNSWFYY